MKRFSRAIFNELKCLLAIPTKDMMFPWKLTDCFCCGGGQAPWEAGKLYIIVRKKGHIRSVLERMWGLSLQASNTMIEPSPTSIMVSATHPWKWNHSRVVDSFPGKTEWKLSKTQEKIPFLERESYTHVKHRETQIWVSLWVNVSLWFDES